MAQIVFLLKYLVPLVVFLVFLLLRLRKNQRKSKNYNLPPGPSPLRIIGNVHQLGHLPHRSFWCLSRLHGPAMLVHLGRIPTIILSSAEATREVIKTHDLDTCSRPRLIGPGRLSYNYCDIAFSPYGVYWREMRKLCILELFSTKRVEGFRFVREEEVQALVERIRVGHAVNLSENFMRLSAGIVSRVAFGRSFLGMGFDEGKELMDIVQEAGEMLGSFSAPNFFPYFGWIIDRFSGLHERLEKNFHVLDKFYQRIIDDHIQDRKAGREEDIVDLLLNMEKNLTRVGENMIFTRDHTKAILLDIFIAGVDTGSIISVWTMTELVRNPTVMKKLQDEIRSCIGNKRAVVTEDDLVQLKYLKLVLKETMRLHPPAVLLVPRETLRHFKLFGYDIPEGTQIQVNVWGIGRDPDLWEDPERFYPERFENSPIDYKGLHFELLVFGAGRRVCPGMYMGMKMVELSLANLLLRFDWTLPDGMTKEDMNMEEGAGLAVCKKVPLLLVPANPHAG